MDTENRLADDARERGIPELFEELVEPDGRFAIEVMPSLEDGRSEGDSVSRPYFVISAFVDGEVVCTLYPNGTYELHDPVFQPHLDRLISGLVEVVAKARSRESRIPNY